LGDIAGDRSTTTGLTVGGSTTSTLDFNGDHDWFAINLVAGQQVTVTIYGTLSSTDSVLVDPLLNIYDSSGQLILTDDDIKDGVNRNSELTITPAASGTYYIDVGGFNNTYTGSYQVSVQPGTLAPLANLDTIAAYLTTGYWGGDAHHFNVTQGGTITVNISTLNAAEQNLARSALQEWTDIIGVTFKEVTTGGQITFDHTEDPKGPIAATDANWSNGIISSAHVHISTSWVNNYGAGLNTYSFQTYIHEIGHALGLGHAGDYNNTATYLTDALFENDAWSTSIMSYFDQQENTFFANQGFSRDIAATPMEAEILAVQSLYGLSTTTRTGDTTYGYNSNAGGVFNASVYPRVTYTIFDSGGKDTLDFSGTVASQLINLNPETFSNVNGFTGNLSIARGTVIENAIGGNGADTIIGNAADNVLSGHLGSDTLTGGAGADTFLDTVAGHNGDTIRDFGAGDRIVFSDAAAGSFAFSLSGNVLSYTGGSLTLGNVPNGTIVASGAAGGGVQLMLAQSASITGDAFPFIAGGKDHNDFNGDGFSDILWRDDSGLTTDWIAQAGGGFYGNSATFLAQVDNSWHIVGTGDFNGDGRVDLLWRNKDGTVTNWLADSNGGFYGNAANFLTQLDNGWQIAGTGDFNGDGRADILWRSGSGLVTDWIAEANGSFYGNSANFLAQADASQHIAGTGDFNGDGLEDILWRSTDGTVTDWLAQADGSFTSNAANFQAEVDNGWHIAGTGDFNGDGLTDMLWQSDSGLVTDWIAQANGGFYGNSANFLTQVSSGVHVAEIGDFNGDAIDDILWRSPDGTVSVSLGNSNGSFTASTDFTSQVGNSWHIEPHHDLF
jgi:hypothetical protein